MHISDYAREMLNSEDFTTLSDQEDIELVRLKVGDMGFTDYATTDQLFAKIKEYELELCPAETGPQYRLAHMDQPVGDYVYIGMKPPGGPYVFDVDRYEDGRWLSSSWAGPHVEWDPRDEFVFRLRKLAT